MNRRIFAGAVAAAVATAPTRAAADAPRTRTIASAPTEDILAALIGRQTGAFERAGLQVDIQKAKSGSAVAAAVAGGALDIGKTNMLSLVSAHVKGFPFTVLAPAAVYNADAPVIGLVVPHDSPLRTAADLNDKIVAVPGLDDMFAIGIKDWVDRNGGDSKRLKFLEVPSSAIANAVEAKRVDAGGLDNPNLSQAIARGGVRLACYPFDAFGRRFVWAAYFSTADWAARNRAAANAFKRIIAESGAYANEHPDATVDLVSGFTGAEPAVIRSMTRTTIGTVADPKMIQPIIDAFAAYRVIPATFDAREIIDRG